MICRFCEQFAEKLLKAHIVPKGFFRRIDEEGEVLYFLTPDDRPRRMRVGAYDPNILCGPCERIFADWDDYSQKLLDFSLKNAAVLGSESETDGYQIASFDYKRLKLFFLSVLWRASVSDIEFCRNIKLGPVEAALREILRSEDPGVSDHFAVTLCKFDNKVSQAIFAPRQLEIEGREYCAVYMGGFVAYIRIDSKRTSATLFGSILRPGWPLKIVHLEWRGSREYEKIRVLGDRPQNRKIAKRRPKK